MQWINDIVAGLLDLYKTNDPYELCDILKIQIEKISPYNPMLRNKKSIYFRNFYDTEIIFIRDDLHRNYEKFYLLHELGHAILHTDIMCSFHNNLLNYDKIEKQANYFALKINDIDICECEDFTIPQIAGYFAVPENVLWQMMEGV